MLTAMMCDHGSAIRARSFDPKKNPASTVEARAPSRALLERAAPLGKPLVPEVWNTATVAEGSMTDGLKRRPGVAHAQESVQGIRFLVGLYPCPYVQCLPAADVARKDCLVRHQDLGAAIGQDPANLGERKKRVQWNGDATGADNRQEPMKALPGITAIDGNRLAWT